MVAKKIAIHVRKKIDNKWLSAQKDAEIPTGSHLDNSMIVDLSANLTRAPVI